MAATSNPSIGGQPLPQKPEEQTPRTEEYPQQPAKQPMTAKATRCNEELARQAADAQAPPRRPRGRPRGSMTARRAEQASQSNQPSPQRSTRVEATANLTVDLPIGTSNNRAPPVAQNPNLDTTRNNPEPDRVNSRPSRPDNGRQPPPPIRHPPSPIRHPSPVQEVTRNTPQRPSCSGSRDGNRQARPGQGNEREETRDRRALQPSGSQMSRSQTARTGRLAGDPPPNHRATHQKKAKSYVRER
ncbi:uncharacterized protein LOC133806461 [Humulus lupulus]|uniref:uncharacterized protein LOC133806461 n=1 Tax=Humulus lupulus TaxID=3486 RepID=UPI002B40DBA6|nr:uncharacterized protein LOC133806461 [Humulus lupulus]